MFCVVKPSKSHVIREFRNQTLAWEEVSRSDMTHFEQLCAFFSADTAGATSTYKKVRFSRQSRGCFVVSIPNPVLQYVESSAAVSGVWLSDILDDLKAIRKMQQQNKAGLERLILLEYTDDLVVPFGCLSEVCVMILVTTCG